MGCEIEKRIQCWEPNFFCRVLRAQVWKWNKLIMYLDVSNCVDSCIVEFWLPLELGQLMTERTQRSLKSRMSWHDWAFFLQSPYHMCDVFYVMSCTFTAEIAFPTVHYWLNVCLAISVPLNVLQSPYRWWVCSFDRAARFGMCNINLWPVLNKKKCLSGSEMHLKTDPPLIGSHCVLISRKNPIFGKPLVQLQGPQRQCSQASDMQIHKDSFGQSFP